MKKKEIKPLRTTSYLFYMPDLIELIKLRGLKYVIKMEQKQIAESITNIYKDERNIL